MHPFSYTIQKNHNLSINKIKLFFLLSFFIKLLVDQPRKKIFAQRTLIEKKKNIFSIIDRVHA